MLMVTTVKEHPGLIMNSYPEFLQQWIYYDNEAAHTKISTVALSQKKYL